MTNTNQAESADMGFFTPSAQMVADMKRWEGSSLNAYADSRGFATQGVGRHHGVSLADEDIDEATMVRWLAEDLQSAFAAADVMFPGLSAIDQVRREALAGLVFNMGAATLAQFTPFIGFVNARDWPSAAFHLLTNSKRHITPYVLQTGARAAEVALRIATGTILEEFKVNG